MTLPRTEAMAENSDGPVVRPMTHGECVHDHSNPASETPTIMAQKRNSDSNSPHARKRGRMSEPRENNDIEQIATVRPSRSSTRTSARAGSSRFVIEQPIGRRTSARRVAEIWSPECLLSNPKSKLTSCNLKVLPVHCMKIIS